MMSLYTGAVLLFTKKNTSLTGDASMTFYKALGQGSVLGIPVPVIILLVVAAICGIVLRKTVYGSHIYAVGSNMINARFSGINATGIIGFGLYHLRSADGACIGGDVLPDHVRAAENGRRL